MTLHTWLSLLAVCTLGAMSPGPSIGVIIHIASKRDRLSGICAAIAHGLGVLCYALLAAFGLALVITQSPIVFTTIKLFGALFLAYIGCKSLGLSRGKTTALSTDARQEATQGIAPQPLYRSMLEGFLISALNPKIALFFLALFSQFVSPNADFNERLIMAVTASGVDMLWYCLVAWSVTKPAIVNRFSSVGRGLEKVFGALLILIAVKIILT